MNLNMNRQAERGAVGQEKASSKVAAPKRRALGDITNAAVDDDSKGVAQTKKPVIFKVAVPEIQIAEAKEDAVEMEDRSYMLRAVDDIDGRDVDNPLLVTCCVNEMYDHFNETEREFMVNPIYMAKQDFVNEKMRSILADWLVSCIHSVFLLSFFFLFSFVIFTSLAHTF